MSIRHQDRAGLAGLLMALAACGVTEPKGPPALLTELPRPLTAIEQQTIASSNAFSFALLRRVSATSADSNVFISPLSASMALGMTLNGARDSTFRAMRTALQLNTMSQQEINESYQSLIALLQSLDPTLAMEIANSVWYRNGFAFNPAFFQTTKTYFDATVSGLNFTDTEATKTAVNGWVSDKTHGKIPKILDEVSPLDVMYLINAVYFKGRWRAQFDPAATRDEDFSSVSGPQRIPLMTQETDLDYANVGGIQVADLPYGNGAFSMTVVIPKPGMTVNELATNLTADQWQALVDALHETKVNFSMPKVRLSYGRKLNDDLTALGMGIAFTTSANFEGMAPGLAISYVKQNSFVDINEEGTEAAAVTIVGMRVTSAPQIVTMRVDRPYLFVIRERLSGTIVFMGKINRIP